MEFHKKSMRTGGKGAPRIPPRKTKPIQNVSDAKLQNTIKSCKISATPIPVKSCMYSTEENIVCIKDPQIKAFMVGKSKPIAFIVKGKEETLQDTTKKEKSEFDSASKELLDCISDDDKKNIEKLKSELESLEKLQKNLKIESTNNDTSVEELAENSVDPTETENSVPEDLDGYKDVD